jgi:filamentous hemagglutinin family protein
MAEPSSTQRRELMRRALARRQARWGRRRFLQARFGLPLALALSGGLAAPAFAQNLPTGGNVTGGSGTIQQVNPNLLTIQQNTQNLAIDWQSFSVGAGSVVRFMQPSSSAIALNRVIGNDPSMIYGQIQANGQVILLNPRGIYFGPNSSVDVNALVATTANIRNDDFMAGRLRFDEGSSDANARVVNEGLISVAQGGFAVLAAASVQNTGRIVANGGSVVLAGTKTFTVDFHGDGLLSFAATGLVEQAPSGATALVENSGVIEANGGRVLMTARAARNVLDNVINTTGIVVAHSAQMVNGEIVIDGGDNGIVSVNGLVDASGKSAGETGGTVKVLGEKVGLFQNARLDVSGDAGGGTALVGGNYQGKGPEANAKMVYMDAAAVIDAGAITSGDGGRVILWSDDATRNYGHINVSGPRDGGFIEVSSKGYLDFAGTVDLRGAARNAGTLLLDPADITIQTGVDSNLTGSSPFQSTGAASSNLTPVTLLAALLTGNVTVTTSAGSGGTGNITINSAVAYVSAVTRTLTLQADNNITISGTGSISSTLNPLSLNLWAANNIAINGAVDTNNGSIVTSGQAGTGSAVNFSNTGTINVGTGSITLNQSGTVSFDATVTSTGTITINNGGAVTQTAGLDGVGGLVLGSGSTGSIALNNVANAFNTITLNRTGTSSNVSLLTSVSPTVQASTLGTGSFSLTGVGFTQSGAIVQDVGGGTVDIIGGTGSATLSSANSFTGALTVTSDSISASTAQTVANVTLKPYTGGTNITFNNAGGGLALSAATVGNFSGATDLTIGSTSAGTLTVAAAYSAPSGQNVNLISGGTMTVGNALTASGAGAILLNSAKNVAITANVTTAGGDIEIEGNVTSWTSPFTNTAPTFSSTSGNFVGVSITGATVSAGGGDIAIAGKGGTTGINQFGVYLGPSSAISTTGTGTVNLVGLGGPSTSDSAGSGGSHTGLYFNGGASGTFVDISTVNGNIALTGTGAGSGGATDNNAGVSLQYSKVRATGTGDIDITGTGGVGGSRGVVLALAPTEVSTVSGDITIFGTGGSGYNATGYGFASQGVDLAGNTVVKTTGSGDISIRAIAGPSSSAFSTTGASNIIGDTLMTGDLTMRADSYSIGGALSITHQNATGTVEFRPDADATTIGAAGGTGTAQIPTALLSAVTNFGTLKIGSATQSGAIDVGMWTPTTNIYLQTSGAISTDALTMAANTLTISNGGAYTQVGGITGSGLVTFLGTGAVTATDPGNSFTNVALTKTGGAAVSLTTTGALNFATSSLGSSALNVTAAGVTQSGAITTSGNAFFNAGANAITLGSANALSGNVRFFNSGANNVSFTNSVATVFGNGTTTVGGNLTVTGTGNVSQASALSVAGNATFSAGGNTITLTNASNAVTGNVAFSNATDTVSWREAAAVSLAASSAASLSVQAGGTITQVGALAVTGASSFNAGANAITLTNGSNALGGSVTLINTGANNVQLTNVGAIDLNGSSVGGNLTLIKTGAGDITQSTPLTVGGTLSADAGSGLITLNQGANSIAGAVTLTSTNVGTSAIQNGGPLDLGTVNITGNLDATGNSGAITQSGVITVGGTASFTTGNYNITLSNASNSIAGDIALTTTGSGNVVLVNNVATTLGATSTGGNLSVTSNGLLTQSAAMSVGGSASFASGTANTTLSQASNSVGGTVTFATTGSGNVTWVETGSTEIAASTIGGNLSVTSGAITLSGDVTTGGTQTYAGSNVDFAGGAVVLTGNGLSFSGAVADAVASVTFDGGTGSIAFGGAVTLGSINAMATGGIALGGDVDAITGPISFGSAFSTTGSRTISSPNGGMTLSGGTWSGGTLVLAAPFIDMGGTYTGTSGGNLSATADVSVNIASASIATNGGNVTLSGNAGGAATGDFSGVKLDTSTLVAAGGNITMIGHGGDGAGTAPFQHGILVLNSAVQTSGGGTISLTGTGGSPTTGGISVGVYVYGAASSVQTANGALTINGTGGAGTGTNNPGVSVEQGAVRTTGTGAINVTGVGGFEGVGVIVSGSTGTITTANGNITVTGTGGGGGANDIVGVLVTNISGGGTIASTGTGQVTLTGTGGSSTGDGNTGIRVEGAGSSISTISGALALTGSGGAGAGNFNNGIVLLNGGAVSTAGGFLTFDGNAGGGGNASGIVLQSGASITTTGAGSIQLDGSGTTNLGFVGNGANTITAGGSLTLISDNGIAFDTTDLSVNGTLTVNSTFANVQLGGSGNTLNGAITTTASGGGNVNLSNTTGTLLGATNISGDFFITSGGAITQSGGAALNVGGAADFVASSGNITLNNATNNMVGSVALTTISGDVSYTGSGAVMLGAAGVGGNLTVSAGGDLLQVGTLSVSGTTNISVGAHLINLSNNNTFSGAVTLSNSGANDVTIVTTGNLDIAGSNVGSGVLTLQAGATGAGILTQSGAIVQESGAAGVFLQSDGNLTLNNPSNAFTGPITVVGTNGGNANLANSTATIIGGAQTGGGTYTLNSSGAISQTGGVNVGDLTLTASGSITMNDPSNFAGDVSLTTTAGGNIIYNEVGATVLKNVVSAGSLTVLADSGSISQATGSTLTVTGTTDLTATTGGAITLSETNSFGGAVTLTAAAGVDITALQTVASGGFTANAGDTITVGSGAGIATSGGAVALNTTKNIAFNTASIATNGGNIDLIDGSSSYIGIELLFSNINAGGGNITMQGLGGAVGSNQAGIWVGSGTTVTTSGTGNITLTGTGGATTGSGNVGVFVYGGTVQTTGSGLLTVTGTGGGLTASSGTNYGVSVQAGGQISATGTGDIVVTGNGSTGGGSGSANVGVIVSGTSSKIESASGDVTVLGVGGTSSGAGNHGINIVSEGKVASAGGMITVSGTGGGSSGAGIELSNGNGTGGIVQSGGGNVFLTGTGAGILGIRSSGTVSLVDGNTGTIQLTSNGLDIDTGIAIQTTGAVTIAGSTLATTLGLLDSASTVNVTAAALANISAGVLELGGAGQTGAITVGTDGAVTVTGSLGLYSSGAGSNGVFVAGPLSVTGNLYFHTTDSVLQAAPLTVGGTTSIIADSGIYLSATGNAMSGTITFASSAGNVLLNNTGNTVIGASSTSGTLDVSVTGGSLSQLGAITAGGDTTVMSDAAIAWTNASNAFGGALYLSNTGNGNVAFAANGPLLLGDIAMTGTGTFSATATNGITQQTGAMLTTGTGAVTLAGGSGAITLGEATNAFGSSLALSGTAGGALTGTVNGATGTAAAALVTASTTGFTFNGVAAGTPAQTTTTTQTTAQTLNEIASVAPIDSATRVTVPTVDTVGSSPSVEATLSSSTSDLSGGGTGGTTTTASGGTTEESSGTTTTTTAGASTTTTQSGGGTTATTGANTPAGGGAAPPAIVVSDSGGSSSTTNDVRSGPAPQPGPVMLVPGVLVANPPSIPSGTPDGGVSGISTNLPGNANY